MPKRVVRLAVGAVVLAIGMGTLALDYATNAPTATTYAQQTTAAEVLFLAAGTSLVLAGMLTSVIRPGMVGDLALLGGLVWFAPAWVGWDLGPPVVRTLAMVAVGVPRAGRAAPVPCVSAPAPPAASGEDRG